MTYELPRFLGHDLTPTKRALSRTWHNSGLFLAPALLQSSSVVFCASSEGDRCGVDWELGAMEEWKSVYDNLNSLLSPSMWWKVFNDSDFRRDACGLQKETPAPQHPPRCCAVVATGVEWTAQPERMSTQGRGRRHQRRRSNNTRWTWGSCHASTQVGKRVNGMRSNGPP